MNPGGHKLRSAVLLALLAAGATGAWAAKLDKTACSDLSTELAGASAAGVKGEMERGPDWAKSNLPPERLASIQRMIEVQEQLEFRCGMRAKGAKGAPAKPDSPGAKDDTPDVKVEAPLGKAVETKSVGSAASASAAIAAAPTATANPSTANPVGTTPAAAAPIVAADPPAPVTKPAPLNPPAASSLGGPPVTKLAPLVPAAATPPAVNPVATQPAAAAAPVVAANPPAAGPPVTKLAPLIPPAGSPPGSPPVTKLAPLSPAAAGQAALPPAGIQPPVTPGAPALKKPADPAAQAFGPAAIRKKSSRRESSGTYVSPDEVSPYSLSRFGSER